MPFIAGVTRVNQSAPASQSSSAGPRFTTNTGGSTSGGAVSGSNDNGDSQGAQYSDENPPNFNTDKAGWVKYYYGEEYLEDGKYPRGVKIDHGVGSGGVQITGYKTTPETHPWLYPGPNDVHTDGKIYPPQRGLYNDQGGFWQGFKATPADIKASHEKRNYYKNGGQGTPPDIVRTMVDDRSPGSPYWQRMDANRRAIGNPYSTSLPYPSPEEVTGPHGRYSYRRQTLRRNNGRWEYAGVQDSRFMSNGNVYDPDNSPPADTSPPPDTTPPPPPPADTTPPPPPADTSPSQPGGPGTGGTVASTSAPGSAMAMVQGSGNISPPPAGNQGGSAPTSAPGMLSKARGGTPGPAAPAGPPQGGADPMLPQPAVPQPSKGMFGT